MKKRYLLLVIILTLVLGIYFIYGKEKLNTRSDQVFKRSDIVNTMSWQMYTDSINGFSFKYPKDWMFQNYDNKRVRLTDCTNEFLNEHLSPEDMTADGCHVVYLEIDGSLAAAYKENPMIVSTFNSVKGDVSTTTMENKIITKIIYRAHFTTPVENDHVTTMFIVGDDEKRSAYLINDSIKRPTCLT